MKLLYCSGSIESHTRGGGRGNVCGGPGPS